MTCENHTLEITGKTLDKQYVVTGCLTCGFRSYLCPVCYYMRLKLPPCDHTICYCCGVEYGYDDVDMDRVRREWYLSDCVWWSSYHADDRTETEKKLQHAFIEQRIKRIKSMWNDVKDSGERQEFNTGSVRDTEENKGDYSLLPWIALRRLAIHYQVGAKKYSKHNWRKGQPLSRYFSSAMRHLTKWFLGWTDEDHLAACLWNVCAILETEEMLRRHKLPAELDDRYQEQLDDEQHTENHTSTKKTLGELEIQLGVDTTQLDEAIDKVKKHREPLKGYDGKILYKIKEGNDWSELSYPYELHAGYVRKGCSCASCERLRKEQK